MSETNSMIRLYYMPQSFPCGPGSSCCGPVGQSEEELREYVVQLESSLPGVKIQPIDMSQKLNLGRDLPAIKLLNTFGAAACPIFVLGGDVVSMGPPSIPELAHLLQERLAGAGTRSGEAVKA
ncbi:MAG: hypothetical protein HXY20_07990 [Acidobacteria bacterium]|nr:hypothetical protein [Acidobacteriota bacterium]